MTTLERIVLVGVGVCAAVSIGFWQMELGMRGLAWLLNMLADTIDR